MGMSDGQFKAYVAMIIDRIKEVMDEKDGMAKDAKLARLLALLQEAKEI